MCRLCARLVRLASAQSLIDGSVLLLSWCRFSENIHGSLSSIEFRRKRTTPDNGLHPYSIEEVDSRTQLCCVSVLESMPTLFVEY